VEGVELEEKEHYYATETIPHTWLKQILSAEYPDTLFALAGKDEFYNRDHKRKCWRLLKWDEVLEIHKQEQVSTTTSTSD
jgi:hypothetical protein